MKLRTLAVAGVAVVGLAVAPAAQAQIDQTVTGIATDSIALSLPTAAVFGSVFTPGANVSSTGGTVTAVSTNPDWDLTAKETGGDGKMARAISTGVCETSAPVLTNAPTLSVAPAIANGNITSTARTLSGSDQVVASASAVPLAATVFNTAFNQVIPANELLSTGCAYTLTTTYTLAPGS